MDSGNLRLIGMLLLFIFGGGLYSLIMSRFTKYNILRFLPSVSGVIFIIYLSYQIYFGDLDGFMPLIYFLYILFIFSVIIGNIIGNIIINMLRKRK